MTQGDPSALTSPATTRDMAAALPTPPMSPRRDEEFYCQDVVFQVEDMLFKVSRRPFEEDADSFQSMYTLPPADHSSGAEGTSDMNPLILQGVTIDEFRALLRVIFPISYNTPRSMTKDQWMSAFRLADMWCFNTIRHKAIAELHRLIPSHAERIHTARLYHIRAGWVEPALAALAQQDVLSADELRLLGWDTVARLMAVRESVQFGSRCTCGCNYCTVAHGAVGHPAHTPGTRPATIPAASVRRTTDFTARIREVFADDLF